MRRALCLSFGLLWIGLHGVVVAQTTNPAVTLRYAPKMGEVEESAFAGKLKDVTLAGAAFSEAAQATGTIKREVIKLDPDKGTHTVRISVTAASSQVGGEARESTPKPADLTLTQRGEVVKPEGAEKQKPLEDVSGMVQGGLPLGALAEMALGLVFSEAPVEMGKTWSVEGETDLPIMGTTTVKATTKLAKVEEGKAYLETDIAADVPAFEVESPMVGKVKVVSGKVTAQRVERQFDMGRSMVVVAKGSIKIEMLADIGFGEVPVAATVEFELKPVEKPVEAPKAP